MNVPRTIQHFDQEYSIKENFESRYRGGELPKDFREPGYRYLVGSTTEFGENHTTSILTSYAETTPVGASILNVKGVEVNGSGLPVEGVDSEYSIREIVSVGREGSNPMGYFVGLSTDYVEQIEFRRFYVQ